MKRGWLFTEAPVADGRVLCIMQTPNRMLSARVEPHLKYPTLSKMIQLCLEKEDAECSPHGTSRLQ